MSGARGCSRPRQGQTLAVGPVDIRILGPPPRDPGPAPEDPNPRALAAVVSHRGFDLFLSGDAESEALAEYDLPPVEAMKVSHHGSADPGCRPSWSGCGRGWRGSRSGRTTRTATRPRRRSGRSAVRARASTAPTATAPSASARGDGGLDVETER